MLIEVCADSIESALAARDGGADRIELCGSLHAGGVTPSRGLLEASIRRCCGASDSMGKTACRMHVLVRPRPGDFVYSDIEMEIIRRDVVEAASAGAHGIVAGFLTRDDKIDLDKTVYFQQLASALSLDFTFHRAFDCVSGSMIDALETLLAARVPRVLTSGGRATAIDGSEVIGNLVTEAAERIVIMPGGGIDENNIETIVKVCNVKEIHGSFRKRVVLSEYPSWRKASVSDGQLTEKNLVKNGLCTHERLVADSETIRKIREKIQKAQNGQSEEMN